MDLVLTRTSGLFGFECKAADAPTRTSSMIAAVKDLGLTKLFVIYPGELNYALGDRIEAVGFTNLPQVLPSL